MTKSPKTPNSFYYLSPSYTSTTMFSFSTHTTRSTSESMTTEHEQPTNLTYPDRAKFTNPNGTQLTNNDSTEINYTIRLVLATTDDSDKENNAPDI